MIVPTAAWLLFASTVLVVFAQPPAFVDQTKEDADFTLESMLANVPDAERYHARQEWWAQKDRVRFDNDAVYRLSLNQRDSQTEWFSRAVSHLHLDIWKESMESHSNIRLDVRVPAESVDSFQSQLKERRLSFTVLIDNVQSMVEEEQRQQLVNAIPDAEYNPQWLSLPVEQDPFFTSYQTYDSIVSFLRVIAATYPKITELVEVGKSFEGLTTYGVRIHGARNATKLPKGVVYHGGQHAREWIGVAVNCYLLRQLVSQYGVDRDLTLLVDTFEYTIIPVMNVDGYIYTQKNRMWRKNRQPNTVSWCVGTDTV